MCLLYTVSEIVAQLQKSGVPINPGLMLSRIYCISYICLLTTKYL